jgi:hypothetical protein
MLRVRLEPHGAQANFMRRFNEGLKVEEQVDPPTVSRWVNGKVLPSPKQMARIEDIETGIHMRLWTENAEDVA